MIDDPHAILLGLYRESKTVNTVKSTKDFIEKELILDDKSYILREEKIKSRYVWKIFHNDVELSRDEVLELYTMINFFRQSRS